MMKFSIDDGDRPHDIYAMREKRPSAFEASYIQTHACVIVKTRVRPIPARTSVAADSSVLVTAFASRQPIVCGKLSIKALFRPPDCVRRAAIPSPIPDHVTVMPDPPATSSALDLSRNHEQSAASVCPDSESNPVSLGRIDFYEYYGQIDLIQWRQY